MNHDGKTENTVPTVKQRTIAQIDLDHVEYNFKQVKQHTSSLVCCVVKANAYGHGAVQLAEQYQKLGADFLAVSNVEEALQLRQNHIALPILILGYSSPDCAAVLAENDIIQCVYSYEYGMRLAERAEHFGVKVKIHVKIDTGMGRIGFLYRNERENEMSQVLAVCRKSSLLSEGIFTHFASADEGENGEAYTRMQFERFTGAIGWLESEGLSFSIRHCANSAAIFDYPEYHLDMVRAGVVLYGFRPSEQMKNLPKLKPVMRLLSTIIHIKQISVGESISYGRGFTAEREMQIATVPIGYADGFERCNGQLGYSLSIGGRPAPIVGRVCMDQLMVDVSDIDCHVGDSVLVFGDNEPFTAQALARLNHTIHYEIVCDVGPRVPRAFLKKGKIVAWKDDILGE